MTSTSRSNLPSLTRLQRTNVLVDVCNGQKSGQEENIKLKVVLPVLQWLGWQVEDMDFEHHVGNKRADIALLVDHKPKVIVEVKSHEKKLEDHKTQTLSYAINKGTAWALLSNGQEYQLFKSFIPDVEIARNKPIFTMYLSHITTKFDELSQVPKVR